MGKVIVVIFFLLLLVFAASGVIAMFLCSQRNHYKSMSDEELQGIYDGVMECQTKMNEMSWGILLDEMNHRGLLVTDD